MAAHMCEIKTSLNILRQFKVFRVQNDFRSILHGCRNYSGNTVRFARAGRSRKSDDDKGVGQIGRKKIPNLSIDKAIQTVKTKISELGIKNTELNLFLGTGQYFHNTKRDRLLVLNSDSGLNEFDTVTPSRSSDFIVPLLDCSLQSTDVDKFSDELGKIGGNIYHGEVNAVDEGLWTHGFVISNYFKIFSQISLLCKLTRASFDFVKDGILQQLPIQDITSVRITLSEEPWNDQTIAIECKDESIVPLLTFGYENDYRDLAMLMVDTEWSVKTAALLCLNLRKLGNKTAHLKLPKVLTIQGNPWVENRHALWTQFSSESTL